MLPHMAVHGETGGHIGFVLNNNKPAHSRRGQGQKNGLNIAGVHKGDNEKSHKKDQRRTKVLNDDQRPHAHQRKGNKGIQVLRGLNFFQRGSAYKDKGNLYKFRGLESHTEYGNPVAGAVSHLGNGNVDDQQQNSRHRHRQAQAHTQVHITHQEHQHNKADDPGDQHQQLLKSVIRLNAADDGNAHPG